MSTQLSQSSAKFDIWTNSAGVVRKTPIGFAYTRYNTGDDSYVTVADSTLYTLPYTLTYTPKYSNSLLQVEWVCQMRTIASGGASLQIYKDGTLIPTSGGAYENADMFYKTDAVNHHMNYRGRQWVTADTTNPITFSGKVRSWGWGGTFEVSYGWGQHMIMVTEFSN